MVNDINTLNGALQELGETMASNLQAKGVTASASDGLTTLAGKILTIPTGGSCYHIEFSEDSYTAVGGTATLEITLQENYSPKSGATVTVTGSDSSLYTGITNNNGVATVTVSNISAETTFTCSYQGVSDTCTVTATVYLINDDASADNSSTLFGTQYSLRNNGTNTVAWNSNGYYTVTTQPYNGRESMRVLTPLTGITSDFAIEWDSYVESASCASGLVIYNSSTAWEKLSDNGNSSKELWYGYNDGSYHETKYTGTVSNNKRWVHYKFTMVGTSFNIQISEIDTGDILWDHTETIHFNRSSSTVYGLNSEWDSNRTARFKNIIAYEL